MIDVVEALTEVDFMGLFGQLVETLTVLFMLFNLSMKNIVEIQDVKCWKRYKLVLHPNGNSTTYTIIHNLVFSNMTFSRENPMPFSYVTFRCDARFFSGLKLFLTSYIKHWHLEEI